MKLEDIFDYDSYLADSCGDATSTSSPPATKSDRLATIDDAMAGTVDIQHDDGGSSTPVAPVLNDLAPHRDALQTESATPSATSTTSDVTQDATTAAPPSRPTGVADPQQNDHESAREHAAVDTGTKIDVGPSHENAIPQRLYAPPPYPPPSHQQSLPMQDLQAHFRLGPLDYLNGSPVRAQQNWQHGWETRASMGPKYEEYFVGSGEAFRHPWNAQPGYMVSATYQYPSEARPLLVPSVFVPSQNPAPPRAGPNQATGSNFRYQPYPTAHRARAQREAAPVGRQTTLRWRAPVLAPEIGQAVMPHLPQTQWLHTNAENHQNGFSRPTTASAHYLLGLSAQAGSNNSLPQKQSQHALQNSNAAPVPSGSSRQAPAPPAPVPLKPPKYDYSDGQRHSCPVCVANPKTKASQKKPLDRNGMRRHYRRIHSGYREAHGGHAECVFCGKRLAVSREGHFRDHRGQNRRAGCQQVGCGGIARLGGTAAHAAIRAFLKENGVPLDHWQIAEDKALMSALLALEDEEDGDEEGKLDDVDAMKEE